MSVDPSGNGHLCRTYVFLIEENTRKGVLFHTATHPAGVLDSVGRLSVSF